MSVEGGDKLRARLNALPKEVRDELQKAFQDVAIRVQAHAIRSIQKGPKTGRKYKRRGTVHQASAPGQPPATDSGELASSVQRVDGEMVVGVGTALAHGKHMEVGTKDVEARPWLFPALEANRPYYEKRVREAFTRGVKKAKK